MIETQWRIVWFPPDKKDVTKSGSKEYVRRLYKEHESLGDAPIIEFRTIEVSEWESP